MQCRSQFEVHHLQSGLLFWFMGITVVIFGTTSTIAIAESKVTWWNMSKFLREFVNNGLVANELQQTLDMEYSWDTKEIDGQERLSKISKRVSDIFSGNIDAVQNLKRVIEREYDTWPEYAREQVNSSVLCCELNATDFSPDGCAVLPTPEPVEVPPTRAVYPPPSVIREMKKNANIFYGKNVAQYFAFNDGSLFMHPSPSSYKELQFVCETYDPRLRYFFTQSKSPEAREVVLVVDRQPNTDTKFLQKVVERILQALSPIDRMALCLPDDDKCRNRRVGSPSEPTWPREDYPLGSRSPLGVILPSSEKNKNHISELFKNWINTRKKKGLPNSDYFSSHVAALAAGFELFQGDSSRNSYVYAGEHHRVLVYVTAKGGWSHWNSTEDLFNQLNKTINSNVHVVIHPIQEAATSSVGLGGEVIMHTNNTKLNVTVLISTLTDEIELYSSPTSIESFGLNDPDRPVIPMPYWDAFGMGYIMSICAPLTKGTKFLGSACTDISIVNLLEAEINVDDIEDAYIFIVNSLGYTLKHPLLPSPFSISQDPTYVTIDSLEQAQEVKPSLESIVRQVPGSKDVEGMQIEAIGRPRGSGVPSPVRLRRRNLRYQWVPINNTDLTIALVLPLEDEKIVSREYKCKNETSCQTTDFQYHSPRPTDNRETCKFFGTEVIKGKGLIKFAPNCFVDVLSYIENETPDQIRKLYAIFNGSIPYGDILRSDLRGSVRLLETAEKLWLQQTIEYPSLNDDIGARYMGTADGAFISFPGTTLRQAYDHRKRPWYLRAVSNPEKASITMTTPYCDELGAGMVHTITKTLHDPADNPVAVVAGDITLQYVMTNFHTQVPYCKSHTCLLVDRLGYVVLKSDWSIFNTTAETCPNDVEIQSAHLNRLAPGIAKDMISSQILKRRACHDYEYDITFYYWSLSLTGHRTLHEGPTYVIHKIPQTSLYLIVKNESHTTQPNCNCDPYQRGEAVKCHDTCALECECPCVAGPETQPCHNASSDVHRYPVPACKPRGLRSVRANNNTRTDLEICPQQHNQGQVCHLRNKENCANKVYCLWSNDQCENVNQP